jgi:Bacterial extracellular solute-binding protein
LNDWWKNGYFSKNYYALTGTQATDDVATGKTAMLISGSWAIHDLTETFKQSSQQWDWIAFPSVGPEATYPLYEIGIGDYSTLSHFPTPFCRRLSRRQHKGLTLSTHPCYHPLPTLNAFMPVCLAK